MKKVLITGASGGIGLETARKLAENGHKLTLVARDENRLKSAVANLHGNGHLYIVSDLTKEDDLKNLVDHIKLNQYDVLINNAGAGLYGKFLALGLQEQLNIMKLNMDALVVLSYAYLQQAKKGDTLINVASLLAHSSFPGSSVYAATKSFVANFSESLWYEFKDQGIYVGSFNPGAAKSDFHSNSGGEVHSFPEAVLSTVESVADEMVLAINNRAKPRVVQGWKNRFMLFGFRFVSRKFAINTMGAISPGMK